MEFRVIRKTKTAVSDLLIGLHTRANIGHNRVINLSLKRTDTDQIKTLWNQHKQTVKTKKVLILCFYILKKIIGWKFENLIETFISVELVISY